MQHRWIEVPGAGEKCETCKEWRARIGKRECLPIGNYVRKVPNQYHGDNAVGPAGIAANLFEPLRLLIKERIERSRR